MLGSNRILSVQDMQKESRRLIKNLSRRVARIEALGDKASQYAVKEYRDIEKRIPDNITKLDKKELQSLYRDLKYINQLKSATVKGAMKSKQQWEPLEAKMQDMTKEANGQVWETYQKLYEIFPGFLKYKYDILELATDYTEQGITADSIAKTVLDTYQNTIESLGENASENTIKLSFTRKLNKLFFND